MHEYQVMGKPVTRVESEARVKFFHLPVVSKWRLTNSNGMSMDWTYLLENEVILGRVSNKVVVEGFRDVEVVVAQTVRRFLGETGLVSSTARMMGKLTIYRAY